MHRLLLLVLFLAAGCATKSFYSSIDGTDTLVGLTLPEAEYVQFNALHYLSGTKTQVKEPSVIFHAYAMSETNSYFGVVRTGVQRSGYIAVFPVEKQPEDDKKKQKN